MCINVCNAYNVYNVFNVYKCIGRNIEIQISDIERNIYVHTYTYYVCIYIYIYGRNFRKHK